MSCSYASCPVDFLASRAHSKEHPGVSVIIRSKFLYTNYLALPARSPFRAQVINLQNSRFAFPCIGLAELLLASERLPETGRFHVEFSPDLVPDVFSSRAPYADA